MMKTYPEYKQTNIKGVDEIPLQWNPMRFRHLFTIGRGLGITKENLQETGIPCVNYGEIHSKYGFELDVQKHPLKCVSEEYLSSSPNSLLNKGDLVFADTSEDLEGSGNFTQLVSEDTTFAGYHTVIARQLKNHDDRFIAYALDSEYCRNQIRGAVKGVKVFSITQAILKDVSIILPEHNVQRYISSYLDKNTARIDSLISEKQNFIKLLQEKRQALISHVVTKGLNPNVEMKDSGVEWIGLIPESWNATPLKYIITTRKGVAFKSDDFCDSGIPLVKASDIKNKSIRTPKVFLPLEFKYYYPAAILKTNELILSTVGSTPDVKNSAVGQIGLVPENIDGALLNQNTVVFSAKECKVNALYLQYLTQLPAYREHLDLNAHGTANQASLNITDMINFSFSIPSLPEQIQIVDFLSEKLTRLNELENETNNSIELLKEHRIALISAAVTGKIDVREVA
jgi:type I restriction enzyme S subunit